MSRSRRTKTVSAAAFILLSVSAILLVFRRGGPSGIVPTAGDDGARRDGDAKRPPGFREAALESGIDFRMSFLPNEQGETFKVNLYDHGCGVAVADYDGDGDDDVLFLNQLGPNALYRNRGDGTFDNVTEEAGPLALTDRIKVGAAFGDYDNDGDQDLYITSTRGGNVLLENLGNGRFRDVTEQARVGIVMHSQTPAFFDYDNDGDLDLFVTNTGHWTSDVLDQATHYFPGTGDLWEHVFNAQDREFNVMFRNEGDGRFSDVTGEAGLAGRGWGGDVTAFDYDEDGDLDLLVTNMFGLSQLYRNDAQGHFDDVTRDTLRRTSLGAIGSKAFDFNNDGRLDLFIADMHSDMWVAKDGRKTLQPDKKLRYLTGPIMATDLASLKWEAKVAEGLGLDYDTLFFGNGLYRNDGEGRFAEVSDAAGMETWWPWGVAVGDFDNDGYEDVFLPSGMGFPYFYWPSCLMRNDGDSTFTNVAADEGIEPPVEGLYLPERIGGKQAARSSRCAAVADFDGDGRLELMVNNFNDRPYYFKNRFPHRHFVAFRLRGTKSNHDAVGAVVKLFMGPRVMVRQVHATGGYLSQSSKTLHFGLGLGDHHRIDRAEIHWPSGTRQIVQSPTVDRLHKITEPGSTAKKNQRPASRLRSAPAAASVGNPDGAPPGAGPPESTPEVRELDGETLLAPWPVTVAPGVYQLGAMFPSAVYVVETSAGLVLVDAGSTEGHGALLRQMSELGLDPSRVRAVLLTHAHGDHSLGAMPLKRRSGATIYAGRDDAPVLRAGGPYEAIFSKFEMPSHEIHATEVDVELTGGEMLDFGDTRMEVLATPGHTPGSVCYVLNRGGLRIFFGGDTVMSGLELGTYSAYLSPQYRGDARAYLTTLRKLAALPIPDILLPGHPRHDQVPQDSRIAPHRWLSMLEHGIHELEDLIERYEIDGADFLDGEPKELLPGLHYLGDIDGYAVYVLATPSRLLLFDAPGGRSFPEWLDSKLRGLGLGSRSVSAVLLTSCRAEALSGLPALVEKTNCQVVSSESCVAELRKLGVPDARLLAVEAPRAAGWIDVKTLPLADIDPGAMGYVIEWCGKTVLVSGKVPFQRDASGFATLKRILAGAPDDIDTYRESLYRLLEVNPNLWLPAGPLHGRNANWYADEWRDFVSSVIALLRPNRP
ncbi:MAG TPA: FG-GAP-like repeat-containing protein [Pirellulales bacterium]|nr:FG-GAP-like repeat-containing protein [Pirellulales bacterium]